MRIFLAILTAGAATIAAMAVPQPPVEAATRAMPGSFTGYAFDACQAPSQKAMDVWREKSPYWGVGIYTSGVNRYCADQKNLSSAWVSEQGAKGWRLLPLHVGLQASCATVTRWKKIDGDPTNNYAAARAQGRAEAQEAVSAARGYGIGAQSTLWYDLEHFDVSRTHCRESALSLVSAWTRRLHGLGYRSGFYSSGSSGIRMLDEARQDPANRYTLPDQLWIGDWNGREDTRSAYLSDDGWVQARVHQYRGGHDETYGGVTINIDSNFMDVGRGSLARADGRNCRVRVNFPTYRTVERGDRGKLVAAGQCFLKKRGFYSGKVHGRFTKATKRATVRLQRATPGLSVTGSLDRRSWTALLSSGSTPLMKYGSAGDGVRRLQRALNAADGAQLDVDGVFAGGTRRATKIYQRDHGLARTGVVTAEVWALLQRGRR